MPCCIPNSISACCQAALQQAQLEMAKNCPLSCCMLPCLDVELCPLVAGETDIEQLGRVIATFGSIEAAWPGVAELPDYGKISFAPAEGFPLEDLLPDASPGSIHLLKRLLQLNPGRLHKPFLSRNSLMQHVHAAELPILMLMLAACDQFFWLWCIMAPTSLLRRYGHHIYHLTDTECVV